MEILRTPDERFADLPDYPFAPNYSFVGGGIRLHHVDEGEGPPILLLHGEPSWSYLYRHMIGPLVAAGYRVLAPDLVGFGRSDKLGSMDDYSYAAHVAWMEEWLLGLDLTEVTLFCQDWGGLIGLRLVTAHPDRFRAVVVSNTGLPTGEHGASEAFLTWREWSRTAPLFEAGWVINSGTVGDLPDRVIAAYDAPFPDDSYKACARIFPSLVPADPESPMRADQEAAWAVLSTFDKPFITAFSDSDPITRGGDRPFRKLVAGAQGMPHTVIEGGGHFVQEDCPDQLIPIILDAARRGA